MKAWIKIMDDMFVISEADRKYLLSRPDQAKREMKNAFEDISLDINKVIETCIEYCNKNIKTWDELFDLDISGFEHKVLIGKSKDKQQIGIEDIVKFRPRVIK